MQFEKITERKETLYFPVIWKDKTSNPEHFFDKNKKILSFNSFEKTTAFLKKERPLLCLLGLKKFPKAGYVKSVSKNDYHILK